VRARLSKILNVIKKLPLLFSSFIFLIEIETFDWICLASNNTSTTKASVTTSSTGSVDLNIDVDEIMKMTDVSNSNCDGSIKNDINSSNSSRSVGSSIFNIFSSSGSNKNEHNYDNDNKTTTNNNNSKRLSLKQLCHYCQINLKSTQNLLMCVKQILSSIPIIQRKARTNIPSELNIWYDKSSSIRSSLSSSPPSSLSDTAGSKRMIELTWMDRRTQCDALSSVIHYLLSYQD
jgi:hypothetical protein